MFYFNKIKSELIRIYKEIIKEPSVEDQWSLIDKISRVLTGKKFNDKNNDDYK